jgi:anti-anti-sigma factor
MEDKQNAELVELKGALLGEAALGQVQHIERSGTWAAAEIWLSLRHVRAVDAAGLALLVRLYSQLRRRGKRVQIVDASLEVASLLDSVGLTDLLMAPPSETVGAPVAA